MPSTYKIMSENLGYVE